MRIIICGCGQIGMALATQLSAEGYYITLIDNNKDVLQSASNKLDVMTILGNCSTYETLKLAELKKADLLIACTRSDETNLLTCTVAHTYHPDLHTIARIRNPEYVEQSYDMQDVFGLSLIFSPELQVARELEKILKYPGFLRRESIIGGKAEIAELKLEENSPLCNKKLSELSSIIDTHVLVVQVLRNGTAYTPNGDFMLLEGDRIFVTASIDDLSTMLKNADVMTKRSRKLILIGGGRVSYYLADLMTKGKMKTDVTIIERDEDRCRELAELLPKVNIICGAEDREILEREGISSCGAFAALTGSEERNILLSLFAEKSGVSQIITRVGEFENSGLLDDLPLGTLISPTGFSCNSVVGYVRAMQKKNGSAVSLHRIADGHAEAIEFIVDRSCSKLRIPLKQLKFKENIRLACISRGSHVEIPNGESVLMPGDNVLVVISGDAEIIGFDDIFA